MERFISQTRRNTYAEINLEHLQNNAEKLLKLNGNRFFCSMVKASAYGHGDKAIVQSLYHLGLRFFGVALFEEALVLKSLKLEDIRILLFLIFTPKEAQSIIENKFTPVVSQWSQVRSLEKHLGEGDRYPIHIKFNTGMNRLGFDLGELSAVKKYFMMTTKFFVEGVCSHIASAEDIFLENSTAYEQLKHFQNIKEEFSEMNTPYFHMSNSSALLSLAAKEENLINSKDYVSLLEGFGSRPGVSLYGGQTEFLNAEPLNLGLDVVMSLKSELIEVRKVNRGEKVSYGGRWEAQKDSIIGVVSLGYADGYLRSLSNKAQALYKGHRVPVVGTVCMDYVLLDLSDVLLHDSKLLESVKSNLFSGNQIEEVVLFGAQGNEFISIEEVARWAGTISYEVMTSVSSRVPRKIYRGKNLRKAQ